MATSKAINRRALKQRLDLFFWRAKSYDLGIDEIIRCTQSVGDTVIFGGMLRDLLLYGEEGFKSDTDLVVAGDPNELHNALQRFSPERTSFGGYRLTYKHSKIDIWCLKDTWAFQKGHVAGHGFEDLLKTTFFNWDAIVYLLGKNQLLLDEKYMDAISERFLDINLEPNPNPLGALKRTYSRVLKDNATLSPRLANYVNQVLATAEGQTWGNKTADRDTKFALFRTSLRKHINEFPMSPFELNPQLALWLPHHHAA